VYDGSRVLSWLRGQAYRPIRVWEFFGGQSDFNG